MVFGKGMLSLREALVDVLLPIRAAHRCGLGWYRVLGFQG